MQRKFFLKLSIFSLIISCATSPTGRKQLIALPDSMMSQMGVQSFDEQKRKSTIETDSKINSYVRCVTNPLLQTVGSVRGVTTWEIVVFREDQVNAFALPGGHIGVYTGLFKAAQNADQLAAVIGHEIGHVLAQHSNERVSQGLVASIGMEGVSLAMKRNSKNHDTLMGLLGLGVQYGVLLPYGRSQESEADIIGLDLMARSGFNPQESVQLWRNMAKASGGSPPEFLSTHPSHSTRINDLTKNMPSALAKFQSRSQQGNIPNCTL